MECTHVLLLLYVDDMFLKSCDEEEVLDAFELPKEKYTMDLGDAKFLVGGVGIERDVS